ncbi:MAG: hypothetical protein LBP85_09975 [Prevotellaceae bacterium]|jgi:hypothetical protein|nr:hypothetical protein [Prevotellaceae bacterium]
MKGNESLKMNNLIIYLKDHPAYIGQVKGTRFTWKEYTDTKDEITGTVRKTEIINEQNTSAVALNYYVLKELTNINLEKNDDIENYFPPAIPCEEKAVNTNIKIDGKKPFQRSNVPTKTVFDNDNTE